MGVPHPPACDDCAQVSRDAPPPLPGGYKVGEKVFFTVASQTFADGDTLVHGRQGEVVGPATAETHKGKGVAVLFPGNNGSIDCYLTMVRRLCPAFPPYSNTLSPNLTPPRAGGLRAQVSRDAPPPLPGGYKLGDKVFFTAR